MPPPESPQFRRDLTLGVTVPSLLALPTIALLVLGSGDDASRTANAGWFVGTVGGAAVLAFLYWSPYRVLGLIPLAAMAWLAAVGHGIYWNDWPAWAHGTPLGLIAGALVRARRGGAAPSMLAWALGAVALGGVLAWAFLITGRPSSRAEWLVLSTAVFLAFWTWARLFRPLFELMWEPFLWVMYRVQPRGPGFAAFPRTGPCLVIANHACWLDPIFLIKVLPRPLTPMMTAKFYDRPVIRPLMVKFGVIRVPEKALKKDAPEVLEAVAALDRGECVVIFPEGYLRRSGDRQLRRFGQGVWQLLKARPDTPVFAAWIEGGWGSYTSHANGPPLRNKKPDVRRRLGVGLSAAITVPPDVLEEHLPTRTYLMNCVSNARAHLGLDPLPPFELPAKAEEEPSA